ncbi:hypothetical protein SNE40_023081 [Patella caerulea]|uniref:Uncharacterized protein n=1 Tax=Patella caerulea TaxID=87958 RepID=A0AAN8IYA3_PATCE
MKRYNRCQQRQQKRDTTCFLDKTESSNDMGIVPEVENVCSTKTSKFVLVGKLEKGTNQDNSVSSADADILQKYRSELQRLTCENRELNECIAKEGYSCESLKCDEARVKHYTGLTYSTLVSLQCIYIHS